MRSSILPLTFALAATGLAQYENITYSNPTLSANISEPEFPTSIPIYPTTGTFTETVVVTEFTTYCPSPTTITTNGATYTVSVPTTLTITDCPCTITRIQAPSGFRNSSTTIPTSDDEDHGTSSGDTPTTSDTDTSNPSATISTGAANKVTYAGAAGLAAAVACLF